MTIRKSKCTYKRVFFGDGASCFDHLDEKRVSIKTIMESSQEVDAHVIIFLKRLAAKRLITPSHAFEEIIKESILYDFFNDITTIERSQNCQVNRIKNIKIHPAYIEILSLWRDRFGCSWVSLFEFVIKNYQNKMNFL